MAKFKGILFDLDGLLIDSEKVYHRVSYQMAEDLEVDLHDGILDMQMGRSPYESMVIFRDQLGITSHNPQELVAWRDRLMLEAFRQQVDLMPWAMEIMMAASKHFKVAIATGSTRNLVDLVVEQLGISDYLDIILPSDEIGKGKPEPEIYLKAAELLNLRADQCYVLEDSSNGSMAGHRAGCYVIAVPNIYTHKQDFSFVNARVPDLREAWKIISPEKPLLPL